MALAEKLLAEILFELQSFAGERTSDFTLLHALGVLQLLFAHADNLAMIEPERSNADEQEGTQHDPENAEALVRELLDVVGDGHRDFRIKMLAKRVAVHNGTKVLGLADKRQRCWHLRTNWSRVRGPERGKTKRVNACISIKTTSALEVDAGFVAGDEAFDVGAVFEQNEHRDEHGAQGNEKRRSVARRVQYVNENRQRNR